MIKTGIFGGTFDPVHYGHIRLAKEAYNELSLDKVIFMPAYIPPHKADKIVSDWEHRVNMLKLAIDGIPYFDISFLEKELQGRSYTARTLSILKEKYDALVFIMGADSFMNLDNWYRPQGIFNNAEIACACRDEEDRAALLAKADEYCSRYGGVSHILDMAKFDASSTCVRENIKNGKDCDGIVPEKVLEYIKENNLYYGA